MVSRWVSRLIVCSQEGSRDSSCIFCSVSRPILGTHDGSQDPSWVLTMGLKTLLSYSRLVLRRVLRYKFYLRHPRQSCLIFKPSKKFVNGPRQDSFWTRFFKTESQLPRRILRLFSTLATPVLSGIKMSPKNSKSFSRGSREAQFVSVKVFIISTLLIIKCGYFLQFKSSQINFGNDV